MTANISVSELLQFIMMLTQVITLCYVVFSNKSNRRK